MVVGSIAEAVGVRSTSRKRSGNPAIKVPILEQIAAACPSDTVASSTSGIKPSDLQPSITNPERLVSAIRTPVYLVPVVEVVGGELTEPAAIEAAMATYQSISMKPVHVRVEIDAFIGDRLLEAVWREALWLVNDGVATTEEIDDVMRYGFGLRWAQMGLFETYRIAGGEGGFGHFIRQFGPTLSWPWTKLMDVPSSPTNSSTGSSPSPMSSPALTASVEPSRSQSRRDHAGTRGERLGRWQHPEDPARRLGG